jgi:hypothetical protein
MSKATTTIEHKVIRRWAEERGGRPARVRTTAGEGGLLRIDFQEPEEEFEALSWGSFFEIFEKNRLAFLYQVKTSDGGTSRFNKFVERE